MWSFKKQDLPLSEISKYFLMPIDVASQELGISVTILKRICRKNGITRWPRRELKYIERKLACFEQDGSSEHKEEVQKLQEARSKVLAKAMDDDPQRKFLGNSSMGLIPFNARLALAEQRRVQAPVLISHPPPLSGPRSHYESARQLVQGQQQALTQQQRQQFYSPQQMQPLDMMSPPVVYYGYQEMVPAMQQQQQTPEGFAFYSPSSSMSTLSAFSPTYPAQRPSAASFMAPTTTTTLSHQPQRISAIPLPSFITGMPYEQLSKRFTDFGGQMRSTGTPQPTQTVTVSPPHV